MSLAGRRVATDLLMSSAIWVVGGLFLWLIFRDSPVGPMVAAVGGISAVVLLVVRFVTRVRDGSAGRDG